jgi:hypothetical protein
MEKDNWKGRLIGRKCKSCIHYVEKVPTDDTRNHTIIGRCRRHAPVCQEGYPVVYPSDWCGDYRMDEEKV